MEGREMTDAEHIVSESRTPWDIVDGMLVDADGTEIMLSTQDICSLANDFAAMQQERDTLLREKDNAWGIHYCCNENDCACGGSPIDPPPWYEENIDLKQRIAELESLHPTDVSGRRDNETGDVELRLSHWYDEGNCTDLASIYVSGVMDSGDVDDAVAHLQALFDARDSK